MRIIIQITSIENSSAIEEYVGKKLKPLERLLKDREEAIARVEVGKSTKHHKKGDVFFAEVNLHVKGKEFRSVEQANDLYAAIDLMKDEVLAEVKAYLDKQRGNAKHGGQLAKKKLRGE